MRIHLLAVLLFVFTASAFEKPGEPDYAAISAAASLVVEGRVQEVTLPGKLAELTEVFVLVENVQKGDVARGTVVRLYHESGETRPKISGDLQMSQMASRCPAFPKFRAGEVVRVYARWDAKNGRFFVPALDWKVVLKE